MTGLDRLGWDTAGCDLELVWGNLMAGKGLAEKAMGQSNYYGMASPSFGIAGLIKDVETFVNLS